MVDRTLTLRELNRALLARQMLLERVSMPVLAAVEGLAGMQAQIPVAPYIGLWTRLRGFQREDLAGLIADRQVVKATLMRFTLHFFTADDYVRLRTALQPALTRIAEGQARQRGVKVSLDALLDAARPFLAEQPRPFAEIGALLTGLYPGEDPIAVNNVVRGMIPLVQVPVEDRRWSYPGNPKFALAEQWLGRPIPAEDDLRGLVVRYLAAFGPATVSDIRAWSGLPDLKARIEPLKSELCTYRDEQGRELLDLPDMPLPDPDVPAPVRFIPDLDNLLLSHHDRTRVLPEAHRPRMNLREVMGRAILVNGFARGTWRVETTMEAASLVIEPFEPIGKADRAALIEEGERLVRFVEPEAEKFEVRFAD